jgi:hypothetical protein
MHILIAGDTGLIHTAVVVATDLGHARMIPLGGVTRLIDILVGLMP